MKRPAAMGVAIALILATATLRAEEAAPEPAQGATLEASADVDLLQEIPDYAAALLSQWSGVDSARGFAGVETDIEAYGRLRDTGEPQEVPLLWCIYSALQNNTDLQVQRLMPIAARTEVRRAQSIFDPAFFGDVSYDRAQRPAGSDLQGVEGDSNSLGGVSDNINVNANAGARKVLRSGGTLALTWRNNSLESNSGFLALEPQYTIDFQLSLNQPLLRDFGLGFTTLLVRIAKNARVQAAYDYETVVSSIVQEVERSYWRLVETIEDVRTVEQGLALARETERQNVGKFKVGSLPRTAVLEAQTEVARREADLILAQNARTVARDNLRSLVNFRPEGSEELIVIEPADRPAVIPYKIDLERSLARALESRPEIQAAELEVRGRAMQLKVAENQLLPRLNFVGSAGTNGLSGALKDDPNPFSGQPRQNRFAGSYEDGLNRAVGGEYYSFAAGLTLEVPIGNGLAEADYARSRVDLEASRRRLRKRQEDVTLEIKIAITRLEAAKKSIEARRIARELAEENLRNQQARYDVGLATTKDLLDFQDRLTQARALEVAALTAYNIQLADLQKADGSILAARNIVVEHGDEETTPWWALF